MDVILWAERHANAIRSALELAIAGLPVARISAYEKALDAMPAYLKGNQ